MSKKSRKHRDPQGKKAYAWEDSFADWSISTRKMSCLKSVSKVASGMYGLRPPILGKQNKKRYSSYSSKSEVVKLAKDHRNIATALHETAHHIATRLYGSDIEDHGKEWLGIYADLLVTFKQAPADAVYPSLRKRGLKFINIKTKKKARKP